MPLTLPRPEGSGPSTGRQACRIRVWTHPRGSADSRGRALHAFVRSRVRGLCRRQDGGEGRRTLTLADRLGSGQARRVAGPWVRISLGTPQLSSWKAQVRSRTWPPPRASAAARRASAAGSCSLPSRAASVATGGPRALLQKWLPDADRSCVRPRGDSGTPLVRPSTFPPCVRKPPHPKPPPASRHKEPCIREEEEGRRERDTAGRPHGAVGGGLSHETTQRSQRL